MNHARIAAAAGGFIIALAGLAAAAQVPTPYEMQKVEPKKAQAKKADAAKAPAKKVPARKTGPKKAETPQAEAPKQAPKTYSTGPTVLRDKEGNVIPMNPEAYPVDSALPSRKTR
jgi:hypothetical protein